MFKLLGGFGFVFAIMIVMTSMFEGGDAGFVVASLSSAISDSDVFVPVDDITGYVDPTSGRRVVYIEKEAVTYTGIELTVDANCGVFDAPCFTGVVRGRLATDADDHSNGKFVYNEAAGAINALGAYNIGRQEENVGTIEGVIMTPLGLKNAAAQLISFDGPYFEGNLSLIRIFLIASLALGFVGTLVVVFVGTIRGLFGG